MPRQTNYQEAISKAQVRAQAFGMTVLLTIGKAKFKVRRDGTMKEVK